MFEKIKTTVKSEEFKQQAKQIAVQVATAIVIGVVVQAATYVVIEGTKSLVNEVSDRIHGTDETPAEIA